ncbi:thiamine pyrophosphate-dependent enzyme [Bombilactobacillus folatiphilus]|uniref:Thiamine pyrophosphate-dependent enzyme n=1 Tax=Bombilactobacillus folatiphilus TaxID=2923362 RepID=A0ABY4P962_9LACO|nr:thiamine pyrophosphate-binding protein [Bombilactobacillus folatiphilus]UQS82162.1 thiamine pyrophosphate-dependent enzyme [Bombilactobacillus folatiphilus]
MTKMTAGRALAQVLIKWQVDHLYGIPADSINNTVEGFYDEREQLKYIQVRHEEVGALAASADAKYTGKIGVCFGSAGPGGVHLLNGLYEAKMDHVPVLAIVGQSATNIMNTSFFQEMNQDPIFADVAPFHRQATNAEQIPYLVDQAIRAAYANKSVSVVILPDDLSGQEIDFHGFETQAIAQKPANLLKPTQEAMQQVVQALEQAQRPLLWIGRGAKNARDLVVQVSEKLSLPVLSTVPATGIMPTDHPNFMGSKGRLGTKPGYEVASACDLILFVGTNYPFARFLPQNITFIQVNNNLADLGKQYDANVTVLADSAEFLQALLDTGYQREPSAFLKAAQQDKRNWDQWLLELSQDDAQGLRAEGVIQAIKDNSTNNAVYSLDVGNNTEWSIRQLPFDQQQSFTMSPWYGTMGFGLPGGMAAQLNYPNQQIWSISGDGGFAMVMPDLLTEVKYQLPVINVVLANNSFGYIEHEKIQNQQSMYGINLLGADWGAVAQGMGAHGFTVRNLAELKQAMHQINELQKQGSHLPIALDAHIQNIDPIDTSFIPVNEDLFDQPTIDQYRTRYDLPADSQPSLQTLIKQFS